MDLVTSEEAWTIALLCLAMFLMVLFHIPYHNVKIRR